ncbi:MAG: TonB-dependent receptor [Gammaproteobacteria bacterium]|nr:TonB-dependent receptor [Gammaproteobacteria bacterium]
MSARHRPGVLLFEMAAVISAAIPCAALAQAQSTAAAQAQTVPGQALPAQAQESQSAGELTEVVVTAEKRESNLQKTAVAVAAVSQADLEQNGVADLTSLQKVAPDVKITNNSAGPTINIRGLYTTQGNSPGAEGVVAVYFDGAYLSESVLQGMLFDLQRVEVDKGPQTTLFGKDAEAGAINIISNRPALGETSGGGELEYGSYNTVRTEGVLNVPIGDTFALRAAGQTYSHRGYMDSGLDDADTHSARLSALWQPNSNESFLLVGDYSLDNSRDDEGIVSNIVGVMPTATRIYVPSNPRDDAFYNGNTNGSSSPFYRHSINEGVIAQNDYDFGPAVWTTLLAYRHYDLHWNYPNNPGQGPVASAPNGGSYPAGARSYVLQNNQSESLETRLSSTATAPWQWVGGLYLYHDNSNGTMIAFPSATATAQSIQIGNPYELEKTYAVFGQTTYTPTALDSLHLTAGGRLEADYKQQQGTFTQFGPATVALVPQSSHTCRSGTYSAEISYDLTPHSLIYADTATAFKAGGYGYGPGVDPTVGPIIQPERIKAYEIGSKNRFLDQRLQLNLEAWIYQYTNFQNVLVFFRCAPVCGGLPAITTDNAGSARYHGVSADVDYLLRPQDALRVDVSWLYARYGTYVQQVSSGYSLRPGAPVTMDGYQSNTSIPYVPHFSGIASYSHTWEVAGRGSLTGRAAAQFQSSELQSLVQDPAYGVVAVRSPSWTTVDLSLRYQPRGEVWSVEGYCHNVANRLVVSSESYSATTQAYAAAFYPPRVIGVTLSARF